MLTGRQRSCVELFSGMPEVVVFDRQSLTNRFVEKREERF